MSKLIVPSRPIELVNMVTATMAISGAVELNFRLAGFKRVRGYFLWQSTVVPAAGYPLVSQSRDGVIFDLVSLIAEDASNPTPSSHHVYPFDVELKLPYVKLHAVNGAATSTPFRLYAQAFPE